MKPQKHFKRQYSRGPRRSGSSGGNGGGNPLSRVYESNGPDVKVRGTAQTVAEKYLQLGRDAQVSGDNVMAESYYQHAEHYLRIIAAAQAYNQQSHQQYRRPGDDETGDEDETGEGEESGGDEQPSFQPERQPFARGEPQETAVEQAQDPERQQSYQRRDRNEQSRDQGGRERSRSRWDNNRERGRGSETPREQRDYSDPARQPQPRLDEPAREPVPEAAADGGGWEAPSFLRRAVTPESASERRPRPERRPRRENADTVVEPATAVEEVPPAE